MKEYIERAVAIERARNEFDLINKSHWSADEIVDFLKRLPAADVVEVRHGKWIEENTRLRSSQFCCSVCHRTAYDPQPTRLKDWKKRCRYAYCPNCGARMDGGVNP